MNQSGKLSMAEKISYGLGGGAGNIMSMFVGSFILSYYTDTAGIAAASIGTMFFLVRLLDGITDIVMGGVVDKTNTKLGKARPWLLISAPLMAIGIILIVNVPKSFSDAGKLVFVYLTYIFLNCISYTIYGIAFSALLARMTRDYKDRNITTTISAICNTIAGIIVGAGTTNLIIYVGWEMTGIIYGIATGVLILIPGLVCKEKVEPEKQVQNEAGIPLKEQLPAVMKNKYFWLCLLIGAITLIMNSNAIASLVYYCNVILKAPSYMAVLMSVGQIPGLIILIIMPFFLRKYSVRSVMSVSAVILIIGFVIIGFANTDRVLLLIGTLFRSIGVCPIFAGIFALVADATDYGEWKYGIRSEGLIASSYSIGQKIGIGLGSGVTAWILAFSGYQANVEVQTAGAISGIRFTHGWLGVILSTVLLLLILMTDVEKYLPEMQVEKVTDK